MLSIFRSSLGHLQSCRHHLPFLPACSILNRSTRYVFSLSSTSPSSSCCSSFSSSANSVDTSPSDAPRSSHSDDQDTKERVLRSHAWYGKMNKDGFIHRSWQKSQGFPDHLFDGRPVIGIANTWSELTSCNAHLRRVAEHVKRGVYEAGGFPLEFPVFSCGETSLRPTAMLFRNLASMDAEEAIRGNPMDGVVCLVGCDKTTPSLLMGAASTDMPTIMVSGGPMLNGCYKGERLGSGSGVWQLSEDLNAGAITPAEFFGAEGCMSRSNGSCMTMGTASTMACLIEALGMTLPGNAAIPAVDSRRYVLAHMSGRHIVNMVKKDVRPSHIITRDAFKNAIRANACIGGSTNAVIHLLAIAGRLASGTPLTLDDWDQWGRDVPTILNLQPSGEYLMEDFFNAGGLPAVLRLLGEHGLLEKDCITANGRSLWDNVKDQPNYNQDVILPWDTPLVESGGIAVLRGNLAQRGAVIKPSAASPELMQHTGPAVVFENIEHYKARIQDLDISENSIMVLKNCGPKGYPGMAEVGNMGLPPKLLAKGVRDMVRISDARMSGTAYGTVILHAAPEAAEGGTLALVEEGDIIQVDVENRKLELQVDDAVLKERQSKWTPPTLDIPALSGYQKMYVDTVEQADLGCDLSFLKGCRGHQVPSRESH